MRKADCRSAERGSPRFICGQKPVRVASIGWAKLKEQRPMVAEFRSKQHQWKGLIHEDESSVSDHNARCMRSGCSWESHISLWLCQGRSAKDHTIAWVVGAQQNLLLLGALIGRRDCRRGGSAQSGKTG